MIDSLRRIQWGLMLLAVLITVGIGASGYYGFGGMTLAALVILMLALAAIGQKITHWWRSGATYFGLVISAFWLFSTYCFNGNWHLNFVFATVALFVGNAIVFARLIQRLSHLSWRTNAIVHPWRFFGWSLAGLLVTWGSYWLAFYPGIMSNDSYDQWGQGSGYGVLSSWHPLIHTFLIGLSSHLFNSPAPLLLIQVIFGAVVVAYVLSRLVRQGMPYWLGALITVGYAVYPINGTYMTTLWKDVPYAILLLLLMYLTSEVVRTHGQNLNQWYLALGYGLTLVMTALFRKNGLYVVVILIVVLVLVYKNRSILLIAGVSLAVIFGFNAYTTHVLHVAQSPTTEALGIPIQQVAAVYATHGNMTKAQRTYFDQILPANIWQSKYRVLSDDLLKFDANFNGDPINNHPKTFLKQWLQLFWRNKQLYITAYLDQTATLWKLNLKAPNVITFLPGLQVQGARENYASQYQKAPKQVKAQIKALYATYKTKSQQAHQSAISYAKYEKRLLYSYQNLTNDSKLPRLQKKLIAINDQLSLTGQRSVVRGAWFTLAALIALAVAMIKLPFKKWSLLFLVPFFNYASLFATVPASDFRYAYSLGFSVVILLMIVIVWPEQSTRSKVEVAS